jgi:alkylation response protein AidB-like acyl-CoA dehydrogenase
MEFEQSSDQEFFRETTQKFLESECPPAKVRELSATDAGFEPDYWRRGAELGWTSLLVSEEYGGGSISGRGVVDLSLLAFEFGRNAAPGPLSGTNVVAGALSRSGTHPEVIDGLLSGAIVGAWAYAEPAPHDGLGVVELRAERAPGGFVLTGTKVPVEAGAQAHHILVTASTDEGLTQFMLPADSNGVTIRALRGVDLTRRFSAIRLEDVFVPDAEVVGEVGQAGPDVEWQLEVAIVMQLAEMVGAMHHGFEMTTEWAFNRYSFGRPLASYQELKHRFADMKMWLEGSYAIAAAAAEAAQVGPEAGELASVGKSYVGQYGPELLHDCIQLHGGIGVTYDHDLHLFLRRVTVNVPLYGSPSEHRQRLVGMLQTKETGR